jgi:ubiquinol-cytochrome c reductase cytochrome c subunit
MTRSRHLCAGERAQPPATEEGGRLVRVMPLLVVLVTVTLTVTLGHASTSAAGPTSTGARPPSQADAQTVYLRDCATCHGPDARGTQFGPTLQGVGKASVDYWVSTGRMPLVANARPAASKYGQPPPAQRLADPDAQPRRGPAAYPPAMVAALVDYVGSLAPGGPDIPTVHAAGADVAAGGEVFRAQCAACHEWAGVGGALYQREAPSLHASTPTQIAEAVRTGPGQMTAFGIAAVPPDQLAALVAYVRYHDHPDNRGGHPLWYLGPVAEGGLAILGGLGLLLVITRWVGERS